MRREFFLKREMLYDVQHVLRTCRFWANNPLCISNMVENISCISNMVENIRLGMNTAFVYH